MSLREPELGGEAPAYSGELAPPPLVGGRFSRSRLGPPIYREHRYATWAFWFVLIAVVSPNLYHSLSDQLLLNVWLCYAIAGIGFYWVFGLAGRFAFCQTFMMAMGGYTSAYVTAHLGPSWYLLGLLLAMLACGAIAAIVGTILSRAQDFYFAIGTLAVAEVGTVVLSHTTTFSGPSGNTIGIAAPNLFGHSLTTYLSDFWLCFVALALVVLIGIVLERSPVRRHAIAGRENAAVARSGGVPVARTQVMLFAFGSMLGGLSGAILGSINGTVDVSSYGTSLAIGIFLMLFIGGVGSIWGPVVGAAFYVAIPQFLSSLAQYENIVYGGLLLVVIIVFPLGLVGSLRHLLARITRRPPPNATPDLIQRLSRILPTQLRKPHLPEQGDAAAG